MGNFKIFQINYLIFLILKITKYVEITRFGLHCGKTLQKLL